LKTVHTGKLAAKAFFLLVFCGVVSVAWRYHALRDAQLGLGETAWRLTYSIECEAQQAGAELGMALPADTQRCRVFRQDFRQENLGIDPRGRSSRQAREIVALAATPGHCETTLQFDLRLNPRGIGPGNDGPVALTANERAMYLRATPDVQVGNAIVAKTLAGLRQQGAQQAALVDLIFSYCYREVVAGEEDAAGEAATAFEQRSATPLGRARAMIALCRAAGIPARPVAGFIIAPQEKGPAWVWVEVLLADRWVPYDPVNGYQKELPYDFVPVRRGDDRVAIAKGADALEVEFSVVQLPRASLGTATAENRPSDILDLTRLPLETQRVLSLILLMPLGALVTCVFRNIVGMSTSGTFTPTLIALSFVFADWRTGLVIFVTAILLGIAVRYPIDWLKLLILPRLSIMLTLVVLCIVFGISALQYYRWTPGSNAVLLPMVILTMLIERFYLTTQEDGFRVALQNLIGTMVVGFCCYLVLRWQTVATLFLTYPEAHFFTVALMILIGRYTGYQLFEAWRFRDMEV
jgi:hypothetical protein